MQDHYCHAQYIEVGAAGLDNGGGWLGAGFGGRQSVGCIQLLHFILLGLYTSFYASLLCQLSIPSLYCSIKLFLCQPTM